MERHVDTTLKYRVALTLGLYLLLVAHTARAELTTRTFALVITNNRSTDGAQPDLQYADDDGARYYRLFRGIAEESDVVLLTSFDRTSRAQYGARVPMARAPTLAELSSARARLADGIRAARARGQRTQLYLVYAGHGTISGGRGYLELEDRQIDGDFIERELLDELPADTKHVILDSCNSFFVMNPRKPGGRRWATPKDMAFGFSARHPEVGLFLSTNSESEVFEWSELESGVFSHEVRSGLSGAADVNGDGTVTYLELAGFVEHANRGIAREALRPHLFFRGLEGDRNAALFATSELRGRKVDVGTEQVRLWIKNAQGERLLDLHKERGPMTITIADPEPSDLMLYVQASDSAQRVVVSEHAAPSGAEPVVLASLSARTPELATRGRRIFGTLFSEPYGKSALARFTEESARTPEPVFGVTRDDLARMHDYLQQFAELDRSRRIVTSTFALGVAGVAGSAAAALAIKDDRHESLNKIALSASVSAGFLGVGLLTALRPSNGERALASFEHELKLGGSHGARAFAETESWLARIATRERRVRKIVLWTSQFVALDLAAAASVRLALQARDAPGQHDRALTVAMLYSAALFTSAYGAVVGARESASERMLKLYREDPGLKLHVTGSVGASSAGLGIGGRF
jgi:hypothetical protein